MAGRLPQVLPPGLPTSDKAFTGDYEVIWSIYIRCNNLQKLRAVHIPALEALIGQPHGGEGWLYENPRGAPRLPRACRADGIDPGTGEGVDGGIRGLPFRPKKQSTG